MLRKIIFLTVLLLLNQIVINAQEPYITAVAWNADGTLLAIGWDDINAPLEIRNVVTGESHFYDMGLTPNGYGVSMILALSPTIPNRIAIANVSSGASVLRIEDNELHFEHVLDGYYYSTSHIDWNADGTRIAIIGSESCCALNIDGIQVWDAETGQKVAERNSISPYTMDVDWHPQNPDLLVYTTFTTGYGTTISQWNVTSDTEIWITEFMEEAEQYIAWNPDGMTIGGTSINLYGDAEIHLYNVTTGERNTAFSIGQRNGYSIGEILWLDDQHILIDAAILEVWNIESQQLIYQIEDAQYMFDWHPVSGLAYINEDDDLIILTPEDTLGTS